MKRDIKIVSGSSMPDAITLSELIYNIRDSVITVISTFSTEVITTCGFLTRNRYIICSIWALFSCKREVEKASNIKVILSNVNGTSQITETKIIGWDGIGNLAILSIDLSETKYLHWGHSRNMTIGEPVIIMGSKKYEEFTIKSVHIGNNRYCDPNGKILGELLLLSGGNFLPGSPVIDLNGKVIGMIIEKNIAVSEYFMRRPFKALTRTHSAPDEYHPQRSSIQTMDTKIYRYLKAYIGIYAKLLTGQDIISNSIKINEIIGYKIIDSENKHLLKDDIITHINGHKLGQRIGQSSPHLILWKLLPGVEININVLRCSDDYTHHSITVTTDKYTEEKDYPHYKYCECINVYF